MASSRPAWNISTWLPTIWTLVHKPCFGLISVSSGASLEGRDEASRSRACRARHLDWYSAHFLREARSQTFMRKQERVGCRYVLTADRGRGCVCGGCCSRASNYATTCALWLFLPPPSATSQRARKRKRKRRWSRQLYHNRIHYQNHRTFRSQQLSPPVTLTNQRAALYVAISL